MKNTKPRSSKAFISTIRTEGAPSEAVATATASGIRIPAALASSYQAANWRSGSASASCSRSGLP